ncbi:MAG: membrane protein insertion efficiency factor YidD [Planctomycetes bacterium]|nr:membrane protein insertion efficiency factor YidD [Planctomycetota bacterium]
MNDRRFARRLLLAAVHFYQRTFAWIVPVQCRFHPSCSHYFSAAVETHGAAKGAWLGLWRVARCQPFGGSGYDPVPPAPDQPSGRLPPPQ